MTKSKKRQRSAPAHKDQQLGGAGSRQIMAGVWLFGGLLFVFAVYVFVFAPATLPAYKQRMLGVFLALLAGLLAWFLTGSLYLRYGGDADTASPPVQRRMLQIQASGGMALFILVFVWWWSPWSPIDVERSQEDDRPVMPSDARATEPEELPEERHAPPSLPPDGRRRPVPTRPDARPDPEPEPKRWTVTKTERLHADDAIPMRIVFEGPDIALGTILLLQQRDSTDGRHFVGETRCRVDGQNTCMLSPVPGNPPLTHGDVPNPRTETYNDIWNGTLA